MTEKRNNIQLGIRLDRELAEKFKEYCRAERREMGAQLEIILEAWFESQKKRTPKHSSTESGKILFGVKP